MKCQPNGYSLIELLVAVVIASIVIAATLASYTIVSRQNDRINADLRLQELGTFAIETLQRHIRNANFAHPDTPLVGNIVRYVTIDQNFYPSISNSDRITVVYDISDTQRVCVRFELMRDLTTNLVQLLETRGAWVGSDLNCIFLAADAEPIAVDVVALQAEEIANATGRSSLIDIFLVLENASYRDPLLRQVTAQTYEAGGVGWVLNDLDTNNLRRYFSSSVYIRNVVQ